MPPRSSTTSRWPGRSPTPCARARTSSCWRRPCCRSSASRYRPRDRELAEPELDRLNRRIVNRLVASGAFFLAPTLLKGRTAMRVAIVNFRTREEDVRALADETVRVGRELLATAV